MAFAALRERFGGRFNLVFTGTFTPAQSLPTVLQAVRTARSGGADRLHLLLVGDGMSRDERETLGDALSMRDGGPVYGRQSLASDQDG